MKRFFLGAASAVALLTAGNAFAAGNDSTITQIGTGNNAGVDQTGSPSDAVSQITQGLTDSDSYNSASVTQGGGVGNHASVTQTQGAFGAINNPSNVSSSNQQGSDGLVTVIQVGDDSSSIVQTLGSAGEYALVGQSNVGNTSSISQGGTNEFALVNQETGTGNSASIVQTGTGDGNAGAGVGNYAPTPQQPRIHSPYANLWWSENLDPSSVLVDHAYDNSRYGQTGADVDQIGSNNVAGISQGGVENFADVSQENDAGTGGNIGNINQGAAVTQSDAVMYQLGQNNIAAINQSGAGSSYSTVWQDGNSNQAYSTQAGNADSSVIGQGVDGDGPRSGNFLGGATNDVATVDQGTDGDTSTVIQLGTNDVASVYQTVTGSATSTITQGGSYNTATVHQ